MSWLEVRKETGNEDDAVHFPDYGTEEGDTEPRYKAHFFVK
jgi:hypothetical protein